MMTNALSRHFFIAMALGLITTPAIALENPTIYGKLALTLNHHHDADQKHLSELDNRASRLGLKGAEAINEWLSAIYQYEVGVDLTTSNNPTFSTRNSFIGFDSQFGQLIAGTFDTPFKTAQHNVDLFNDTRFDMSSYLAGEVRHPHSIQYTSPLLFNKLTTTIDWLPAQQINEKDGLAVSLTLNHRHITTSLALAHNVAGDGGIVTDSDKPLDAIRATLIFYPVESIQLGVMAQQAQGVGADNSREIGWLTSIAWTLDRLTLKAQTGVGAARRHSDGSNNNATRKQWVLGMDYQLTKNLTTFAYAGLTHNHDRQGNTQIGASNKTHDLGLGMSFQF